MLLKSFMSPLPSLRPPSVNVVLKFTSTMKAHCRDFQNYYSVKTIRGIIDNFY